MELTQKRKMKNNSHYFYWVFGGTVLSLPACEVTHSMPLVPFLKTSENPCFCNVCEGYRKRPVT